jgi:uncharacterized protein (TIGR00369 family)
MTYIEDIGRIGRKANPFFCLMGIDPVSYGNGRAELSMEVRPDMLNGAGWVQGGIYVSLIDEAMALAMMTVIDDDEGIATVSETTQFIKGVREGRINAKAHVVRAGRKIIFAEGFAFASGKENEVLARTTASFSRITPK